jgi:hypothetical protein
MESLSILNSFERYYDQQVKTKQKNIARTTYAIPETKH